jgi:glucosamine-6-phosphate deaminase
MIGSPGMDMERRVSKLPVQRVADYDAMSDAAAEIVASAVAANPELVLALPTGSTPLGMFKALVKNVEAGSLDLSRAHFFCLDEYVGVTPDDPNSLTGWLFRSFMDPARVPREHIHTVPATALDPDAAVQAYEAELAALGGLQLAVLGLGPNGHIAYNEPGSTADSRTRTLQLTQQSIDQASAYWTPGTPTPSTAMTMGVATLLEAQRIVLIVSGSAKADMLRRALDDEPSADVPASWLQLAPDKTLVIADEAAAAKLSLNG